MEIIAKLSSGSLTVAQMVNCPIFRYFATCVLAGFILWSTRLNSTSLVFLRFLRKKCYFCKSDKIPRIFNTCLNIFSQEPKQLCDTNAPCKSVFCRNSVLVCYFCIPICHEDLGIQFFKTLSHYMK